MKAFQWLEDRNLGTDSVYVNDELSTDFMQETGIPPCWPVHIASEAAKWQGVQLSQPTDPDKFVCLAEEIAVALAQTYAASLWSQVPATKSRSRRLREAMVVLRAANV